MKKKYLFLIIGTMLTLALLCITFLIKDREKTMQIDIADVEKIECSSLRHTIGEYADKNDMIALISFLNSFVLTKRYEIVDCQRPSIEIIIYYKDGSAEHLEYRYTSIVYRGKGYEIDINKTSELDRLLFQN